MHKQSLLLEGKALGLNCYDPPKEIRKKRKKYLLFQIVCANIIGLVENRGSKAPLP